MFTIGNLLNSFNNIGVDTIITIKHESRITFHGFEEDMPESFLDFPVMFFELIGENNLEIETW